MPHSRVVSAKAEALRQPQRLLMYTRRIDAGDRQAFELGQKSKPYSRKGDHDAGVCNSVRHLEPEQRRRDNIVTYPLGVIEQRTSKVAVPFC